MIANSIKSTGASWSELRIIFGVFILIFFALACNHDGDGSGDDASSLTLEVLASAEPDECFCGIGAEDNGPISNSVTGDCSDLMPEPPLTECLPKISDSYMWSLTKIGKHLWFGTWQNSVCSIAGVLGIGRTPMLSEESVCELGESHVASSKPNPFLGDHRTPKIFSFNTKSNELQQRFVDGCEGGQELLDTTLGLRQSGSLDNGEDKIVILAGPSFFGELNMFAFDPDTFECIAAKKFPEYYDGRQMRVFDGVLYAAVAKAPDEDNPVGGGRVLRWAGSPTDPLVWEEVGNLETIGAYITVHEGRIIVGTWPNNNAIVAGFPLDFNNPLLLEPGGIFMSPPVPPEGLTSSHAEEWVQVWSVGDYEPDPIIAAAYGTGAMTSFSGQLFWGTVNPPTSAFVAHAFVFQPDLLGPDCREDPECSERQAEARINSARVTSVFRSNNLDGAPSVELLYGEAVFSVFDEMDGWIMVPNSRSLEPLFGTSGFQGDKTSNIYTWTMEVYRGSIFLGTADGGGGRRDLGGVRAPTSPPGGDLYRFSDLESPAEGITLDGFGGANGFRVMISDEDGRNKDDGLYLGTTGLDNLIPGSGWKLLRLK